MAGVTAMSPTCPHCGRDLAGDELVSGLCNSEYCPRHDCPECEGMGFTYDDDGDTRLPCTACGESGLATGGHR